MKGSSIRKSKKLFKASKEYAFQGKKVYTIKKGWYNHDTTKGGIYDVSYQWKYTTGATGYPQHWGVIKGRFKHNTKDVRTLCKAREKEQTEQHLFIQRCKQYFI